MPAVNPKVILELRVLEEGSPGLLRELIDLFLREADAHLLKIRSAFSARDASQVERSAHTLKGSSGNLGAMAMSRLCGELQALGRSVDWDRASGMFSKLEAEFQQVKSELEAERSRA